MSFEAIWESIGNEFSKMEQAIAENQRFLSALDDVTENSTLYDGLIGSIAMNLQSFYTGAERVLLKISRNIDKSIPKGENWHKALIEQMAIKTYTRPALLSSATFLELQELCKFRHFIRNAYSYSLDAPKVLLLANVLTTCWDHLYRDYLVFKQAIAK